MHSTLDPAAAVAPRRARTAQSTYARVAGAAYLVVIGLPLVSLALIHPRLYVAGDTAATIQRLTEHPQWLRLELTLDLVMFAAVILLAAAHHAVLARVDANLSRVALLLRCAEAVVGCATVLTGAAVAVLASGAVAADRAQSIALFDLLLRTRATGMDFVLLLLGLGAIPFCYLFYTSRLIPRALSVAGIACYAALMLAALTDLFAPQYARYTAAAFAPGTVFELAIGAWLLLKGVDERRLDELRPA